MNLLFFILLMVVIGVIINYAMEYYFHDCAECKKRKCDDALKHSEVHNVSVDDCMDELMND